MAPSRSARAVVPVPEGRLQVREESRNTISLHILMADWHDYTTHAHTHTHTRVLLGKTHVFFSEKHTQGYHTISSMRINNLFLGT